MAKDAFIQIQGCEGESTDKNHSNWTEIQDWTWGVEQPTTGTASTGGARTSGRLTNEPFVFTAMIDAAYPKLLTNCCKGSHIPKATVQLTRATGNGNSQVYMQYTLSDLVVSDVALFTDEEDGGLPKYKAQLTYGQIQWQYTQLDHKTGAAGANIAGTYDAETNTVS